MFLHIWSDRGEVSEESVCFYFYCPLKSRLFCHSRFCAPIILFNGHVDININAFHFGGVC